MDRKKILGVLILVFMGVAAFLFFKLLKEDQVEKIMEIEDEPIKDIDEVEMKEGEKGIASLPSLPPGGSGSSLSLGGGGGGGGGKGAAAEGGQVSNPSSEPGCQVSLNYGKDEKGTATHTDDSIYVIVINNNANALAGEVRTDGISEGNVNVNPLASVQHLSNVMTSWWTGLTSSSSKTFTVQLLGQCNAQTSVSLTFTQDEDPLD